MSSRAERVAPPYRFSTATRKIADVSGITVPAHTLGNAGCCVKDHELRLKWRRVLGLVGKLLEANVAKSDLEVEEHLVCVGLDGLVEVVPNVWMLAELVQNLSV